jgi:anti-sigma regulatory factor (Ser/Thr protein kinase)
MTWPADATSAHRALLYRDEQEFRAVVGPFIREGLARGEQILAVVPAGQLAWIRAELGADHTAVEFADSAGIYRRQGEATRVLVDWLRRHASDGQRARIVAEETLADRVPAEVTDYLRMEAAANVVYSGFPVSILCPYNDAELPGDVLAGVCRTHPELIQGDRARPSESFGDPRSLIRDLSPVVEPPPGAASIGFGRGEDLVNVRQFLREQIRAAGLEGEAAHLLLAGAGEVITNALVHGRAPRRLWVYTEGPMLVCHVHDGGPGIADPLATYLAPDRHATQGHGLWLSRQACDALEMAADGTGTHVRLLTRRPHPGGQEPVP